MQKTNGIIDQLGPAVSITNEILPNEAELNERLRSLGKAMAPKGHRLESAFATYVYVSDSALVDKNSITLKHQSSLLGNLSEKLVSFAVADLSVHLMQRLFGRKAPSTRDARDKRQDLRDTIIGGKA